jgi:uncharacterized protein YbjQ (UPF0145 family)
MKYTRKKYIKNAKRNKITRKNVIMLKGGAWYSFFLPLFGYKSETDTKLLDKSVDKSDANKDIEPDNTKEDNLRNPEKVIKQNVDKKGKGKVKGNKPIKTAKELYKTDVDDARIEKEFYPNKNITTWCFDDPKYEPVGVVHVTSVVGINILRSYATIARNVVGVKGTIDENMHQLRNEIYTEMENVMEKKNIDKICGVGVAFTKDSGSLILSAFGTALRRITGNE